MFGLDSGCFVALVLAEGDGSGLGLSHQSRYIIIDALNIHILME